jgi:acyl-CoA synthetase (AMP-forming)/AMP-acid ligase II
MTNTILTLLSRDRLAEHYAAGHWRDETIASLVHEHAARAPAKAAVRDRSGLLTYRELDERADALATDLAAAGLRPGQRVAVWLTSRAETAIALVACSRAGYVCCPSLHRDHTVGDILELLERMRAAAFIGEAGYGADAARRDIFVECERIETLRRIYRLPKVGAPADENPIPRRKPEAPGPGVKTDPNQVVYLAFTSGTTGRPKGVMHSDNTLLANARAIMRDWSLGADAVIYTMSPFSHNLGLGSLIMGLAAGAEVVVHDLPRGASVLDRIVEVGATFLVGVPTHAIDLLGELRSRGLSGPGSLRGFRISGASAPREIVAELLRYGVIPQAGYGMTEAGSHHYTLPTDGPDRIVETSGRACDGYEVKIFTSADPDVEAAVGEVGQIGGRGASLMLGYFDDQAANEDSFNRAGWFMTGDLGRMDDDGYLQITGRKKELIIRGGHNIYPARIENLAMQHPAVARAAVVPVPDLRLGEKVCLAVVAREGQTADATEVLRHLDRSGLSRYDMPEYFIQLPEIPLTASGKIYKRDLIVQVADGTLKPTPVRWQP